MIGRALSLLLVLVLSTGWQEASSLSSEAETSLFPARVTRYEVKGNTPEEIRSSMDSLGPIDELGRRRDAFTRWHISWKWPSEDGKPLVHKVELTTDIEVTLPKLIGSIDPNLQTSWNNFLNAIIRHESEHVHFVTTLAPTIREEIIKALIDNPSLSYRDANKIGKRILKEIRASDLKLDQESDSGKKEGVVWPPLVNSTNHP